MFVLAHQSFFYFFGNSRVHTQVFVIGYAGAVNLSGGNNIARWDICWQNLWYRSADTYGYRDVD